MDIGLLMAWNSPGTYEIQQAKGGEPPCRASPSGRPGRTRRGDKVGFRFRLHGRSTSPSRQSPQVERESDQSTRKRPSPTQQFVVKSSPDSYCRATRSGEWRQVLTQPHHDASQPCHPREAALHAPTCAPVSPVTCHTSAGEAPASPPSPQAAGPVEHGARSPSPTG